MHGTVGRTEQTRQNPERLPPVEHEPCRRGVTKENSGLRCSGTRSGPGPAYIEILLSSFACPEFVCPGLCHVCLNSRSSRSLSSRVALQSLCQGNVLFDKRIWDKPIVYRGHCPQRMVDRHSVAGRLASETRATLVRGPTACRPVQNRDSCSLDIHVRDTGRAPRNIERLPRHNNFRFDRVSWSCDGHECPSYRDCYFSISPEGYGRVSQVSKGRDYKSESAERRRLRPGNL